MLPVFRPGSTSSEGSIAVAGELGSGDNGLMIGKTYDTLSTRMIAEHQCAPSQLLAPDLTNAISGERKPPSLVHCKGVEVFTVYPLQEIMRLHHLTP